MGIQFCGGNYPKKNWVGWKAVLLSLSGMEEDQQAQIGGNEFWTFTQVERLQQIKLCSIQEDNSLWFQLTLLA